MKAVFPSVLACLSALFCRNDAHNIGFNEESDEDLRIYRQRNDELEALPSAHSYRFVSPPRPPFTTPYETSNRRISDGEGESEGDIYYPMLLPDSAENEIKESSPPPARNYPRVFSYKDHKIVPQLPQLQGQTEWNKSDEGNDIHDNTDTKKMKDDKGSVIKQNSKISEYEDVTNQHQKARIKYLKNTMVRTELPHYELYAEKNYNGESPKNKGEQYKETPYPPVLPPYHSEPQPTPYKNEPTPTPYQSESKPTPYRSGPTATQYQSGPTPRSYLNGPTPTPLYRQQTDVAMVQTPGLAGQRNPGQQNYANSNPSEIPMGTYSDSTQEVETNLVNDDDDPQGEKKKGEKFPSFPERKPSKLKSHNENKKIYPSPKKTKKTPPINSERQSRHDDSPPAIIMNREFLQKPKRQIESHLDQFSNAEDEKRGHGSDRIERQVEYSPTGSNPRKIFGGFESSEFLSQVGNRLPKSISTDNQDKERFTKSIPASALHNLNEPLFYPEKPLTPPGHQARSSLSERASGTTRSPPRSPYAPKFEYQVTPKYKAKPLAYKNLPTKVSPYSSYSPTPLPYSSLGSAEYSNTPSPTYSPTPYNPSTTLSPYYAKNPPHHPRLVDGNIDLVEDRIADPDPHAGHHAPYTPSYSNSFGLNKNYGHNKPPHHPHHHAPHPGHHGPLVKSIHPVTPVHAVKPHHPVTPHHLPRVVKPHAVQPLHPAKHVPVHGGGPIHPGATRGYSVGVDHGYGTSYQKVSGFDDYGNKFGYEHGVSHTKPLPYH